MQNQQNDEALKGLHDRKGDGPSGERWLALNKWMLSVRGPTGKGKGIEKVTARDADAGADADMDSDSDAAADADAVAAEVRK